MSVDSLRPWEWSAFLTSGVGEVVDVMQSSRGRGAHAPSGVGAAALSARRSGGHARPSSGPGAVTARRPTARSSWSSVTALPSRPGPARVGRDGHRGRGDARHGHRARSAAPGWCAGRPGRVEMELRSDEFQLIGGLHNMLWRGEPHRFRVETLKGAPVGDAVLHLAPAQRPAEASADSDQRLRRRVQRGRIPDRPRRPSPADPGHWDAGDRRCRRRAGAASGVRGRASRGRSR